MGHTFIAGSSAVVVLALGLFVALERPGWLPLVGGEQKPVLIFLVGNRSGVELVKKAVDPARVVAQTPDAFALAEGRMVATNPSAISEPLMAAGWSDRQLEIFSLPKNDGLNRGRKGKGSAGSDDPRMGRLMELMNKPTLSQGEALFVMQAMNDGLLMD
jgi:hypothetical protein